MDKAYIVANKKQELDVLKKFEDEGVVWIDGDNPTDWLPSEKAFSSYDFNFPYIISFDDHGSITWLLIEEIADETIVYDGRKEDKMSKKYLVTQEFMDELIEWRDNLEINGQYYVTGEDIYGFSNVIWNWWRNEDNRASEQNNRLIAIIRWLNGEDVFETQKTYKYYIARTSSPTLYFSMKKWYHSEFPKYDTISSEKKIFDTREEAEKWLIPGYEVVEIDENELQR